MQVSLIYIRGLYAVSEAIKKWCQYLLGRQFHIYTDQKSLKNLLSQKIRTPEQQKWAVKIQGLNFDEGHLLTMISSAGKSNQVADALSWN